MPLTTGDVHNKLFIYVGNRFNHMFTVRKYLHYGLIGRCYTPTVVYFGKQVGFLQEKNPIRGLQYFENYFANYINEDNTVYNFATFLRLALKSTTY